MRRLSWMIGRVHGRNMARGSPRGQAACRDVGHARCTAVRRRLAKVRFATSLQSACASLPCGEPIVGMLLRLTRSMRIKVGRVIALAYLFCVLAPAASLAWGSAMAPCLGDEVMLADLVQVHHPLVASHGDAPHEHAGARPHHHVTANDEPVPHHHGGKGTVGPCCAMMCVSALPADLPSVAKPLLPISACAPEIVASLRGAEPPQHYRPPIA